jgi:uncharacterized protein YegJ (DUF2314 family)
MTEPSENVQFFCREHSPKPRAELHDLPAHAFVGIHVKRAFSADPFSADRGRVEHMWVRVEASSADGRLVGRLDNCPVFDVGYQCGDRVTFPVTDVEDVFAPGTAN